MRPQQIRPNLRPIQPRQSNIANISNTFMNPVKAQPRQGPPIQHQNSSQKGNGFGPPIQNNHVRQVIQRPKRPVYSSSNARSHAQPAQNVVNEAVKPKQKIDPSQMPQLEREFSKYSLVDCKNLESYYSTTEAIDYLNYNDGDPDYIRLTTRAIPRISKDFSNSNLPLAAVVQPFSFKENESLYSLFKSQNKTISETMQNFKKPTKSKVIPSLDATTKEPQRCSKCKGYKSFAFCQLDSSANFWKCHLCFKINNENQERKQVKIDEKQLIFNENFQKFQNCSSFEINVGKAYFPRIVKPRLIFCIDVTDYAVFHELSHFAVELIRKCFSSLKRYEIGIITFNETTVSFYNSLSDGNIQEVVMSDVDNPCAPLPVSEICSNDLERLERLLCFILNTKINGKDLSQQPYKPSRSCGSVGVCSAYKACIGFGGRVIYFCNQLSNVGRGSLKNTESGNNCYSSAKESDLYNPTPVNTSEKKVLKEKNYLKHLANRMAIESVTLDIICLTDEFVGLPTLRQVTKDTNGDIFFQPSIIHGNVASKATLRLNFQTHLEQICALDGIMKVRSSVGFTVKRIMSSGHQKTIRVEDGSVDFGTFTNVKSSEVYFPSFKTSDNFCVQFERDRNSLKDPKHKYSFVQVAFLYTTFDGQRKLRVHDARITLVDLLAPTFAQVDNDTLFKFLITRAVYNMTAVPLNTLQDARNRVTRTTYYSLWSYKQYCSDNPTASQLLLPDSLKCLPLFSLAILNSKLLRRNKPNFFTNYLKLKQQVPLLNKGNKEIFDNHYCSRKVVRVDDRNAYFNQTLKASSAQLKRDLLPRVFDLLDPDLFSSDDAFSDSLIPAKQTFEKPSVYFVVGREVFLFISVEMKNFKLSLDELTVECCKKSCFDVTDFTMRSFHKVVLESESNDVRFKILYLLFCEKGIENIISSTVEERNVWSIELFNEMLSSVRVVDNRIDPESSYKDLLDRALVQDKKLDIIESESYNDYLCRIHSHIRNYKS